METKQSIFKAHLAEWLAAKGDREKRGEMIEHISKTAKIHPKSVGRSFLRVQMKDPGVPEKRGRPREYGKDVDAALYEVWSIANRPCGERLHSIINEYVDILMRDGMWTHSAAATERLRKMSEGTVKERVGGFKEKYEGVRGKSTTKPSHIKSVIPIFKGPWDGLPPGNGQLDTVAHCGTSVVGDYAYTVNYTDIATYWGKRRAQWNKGQHGTLASIEHIRVKLPFALLMAHPDTGSEFINWHAKGWFDEQGIKLTRSEPGKKNDNMCVEERNGHVIREYLGYRRFDCKEVVSLLNELYEVLDMYLNHFQPVRRTVEKVRVGAKYKRKYENVAKTPYQRLMAHEDVADEVKETVRREHESLNPKVLKEQIDARVKKIYSVQKAYDRGGRS